MKEFGIHGDGVGDQPSGFGADFGGLGSTGMVWDHPSIFGTDFWYLGPGSQGGSGLFPSLCLTVEAPLEPMSGLALFLIVFFSLVAIVFAIVIGIIVYNKWQEQSRKHFY